MARYSKCRTPDQTKSDPETLSTDIGLSNTERLTNESSNLCNSEQVAEHSSSESSAVSQDGVLNQEETFRARIQSIYENIISWHPNLMKLPHCKHSNELIRKIAHFLELATSLNTTAPDSIKTLTVFSQLILQKTETKKSLVRKTLEHRIKLWKDLDIDNLFHEAQVLQQRKLYKTLKLVKGNTKNMKRFIHYMTTGRTTSAIKMLDKEDIISGIHELDSLVDGKSPEKDYAQSQFQNTEIKIVSEAGAGLQAHRFMLHVARKISAQKDRKYTEVISWLRQKIGIVLARSSLLALHATRSSLHNPIGDGMNENEVTGYRVN
ncbi:hypothetical protein GJ496_004380 [Pomphorhynchus laevis]|nr:hypothetical protein GJ496_004380 [Pomphorhynchus laevis]